MISMQFPANHPLEIALDAAPLGAMATQAILRAVFGSLPEGYSLFFSARTKKLIVKLPQQGPEPLQGLAPDFKAMLAAHDGSAVRGVSICTDGLPGSDVDVHSRYFAPWNGIDEDPVNGSSHTVITPLWWPKRRNPAQLVAHMESARGGRLVLKLEDEGEKVPSGLPASLGLPRLGYSVTAGSYKPFPLSLAGRCACRVRTW